MNVRITVPRTQEEYEAYMKESVENQFPPNTTELMMAAAYGDIFTLKKSLSYCNQYNSVGNNALIYACSNGSVQCIKILLEREDIRHRNNNGLSGVDCAFRARRMEACGLLEEYCISHGYDDLKPVVKTTLKQQKQAVEKLKLDYGLDAAEMFPSYACVQKAKCACGYQFKGAEKYCPYCGTKRKQ